MSLIYNYDGLDLPAHIAFIMDGNGRWAKKRGKKRTAGHRSGADAMKSISRILADIGIPEMTVYAFSTENWSRPKSEVDFLMNLLSEYLKTSIKDAKKDNMRVTVIGDKKGLSSSIQKKIIALEESSRNNAGLKLNIAINYGSRDEIVRAVNKFMRENSRDITEQDITNYLDTTHAREVDLLVRSSGEQRLSNFLLWQLAYTELFFTPTLWPDMSEKDVYEAILFYGSHERRYGGIK